MIFIIDTTRHFEERKLNGCLKFFQIVASHFVISQDMIRVGMVAYSSYSLRAFGLNDFSTNSDVEKAILEVEHPPGTRNTADALLRAFAMLTNTNTGARTFTEANKVIILVEGLTIRVLKHCVDFAAIEMKFRNP